MYDGRGRVARWAPGRGAPCLHQSFPVPTDLSPLGGMCSRLPRVGPRFSRADSLGQLQLFYFWNGLTVDHFRLADNKGAIYRGSSNGDAKVRPLLRIARSRPVRLLLDRLLPGIVESHYWRKSLRKKSLLHFASNFQLATHFSLCATSSAIAAELGVCRQHLCRR